jgi:hypothetical protein
LNRLQYKPGLGAKIQCQKQSDHREKRVVGRKKVIKCVSLYCIHGICKGELIPTAGVGVASRNPSPGVSGDFRREIPLQTPILMKMDDFQMAVTSLILGVGKNP